MFKTLIHHSPSPVADRVTSVTMFREEEEDTTEDDRDNMRDFQAASTHEPALLRLRNLSDQAQEPRVRAQSFSLNRNLCSDRDRSSSFSQTKSHNYLERVKLRRQQQEPVELLESYSLYHMPTIRRYLSYILLYRKKRLLLQTMDMDKVILPQT